MRKLFAVLTTSVVVALAGLAGGAGVASAKGNACPDKSKNPTGTPPNCGHPAPAPTCQETGPVSSIVAQVEQGFRSNGGGQVADILHQVNCQIIVPLENALGL